MQSIRVSLREQRLLELRDELRTRLADITAELSHKHDPLSANSAEQIGQRENDDVLDSLRASTRAELAATDAALQRLEAGSYGICGACHQPIEPQRLDSVPYAGLCRRCARMSRDDI
jgi:DnaK suppressor protein